MRRHLLLILAVLLPLGIMAGRPAKYTHVELRTTMGTIHLALYDATPIHRDNFRRLARSHAYDGIIFHRVIDHFMIQAGDPTSRDAAPGQLLGDNDIGDMLPAEIRPDIRHKRGSLAAAREGDDVNPERKSSGSQFYIALDRFSHLDGKYTVFGEVIDGLDVAERIEKVATDGNDRPIEDVRIISTKVHRRKVKL